MRLLIIPLILFSLCGCKTIESARSIGDKLSFLNQKIDNVKEYSEEKIADLEVKKAAFEQQVGHEITKDNAKDTVKEVVANPSLWPLLTNPDFWGVIGLSLAGLFGAKKVGGATIKKLHKTGREMVGPGEGPQV